MVGMVAFNLPSQILLFFSAGSVRMHYTHIRSKYTNDNGHVNKRGIGVLSNTEAR